MSLKIVIQLKVDQLEKNILIIIVSILLIYKNVFAIKKYTYEIEPYWSVVYISISVFIQIEYIILITLSTSIMCSTKIEVLVQNVKLSPDSAD